MTTEGNRREGNGPRDAEENSDGVGPEGTIPENSDGIAAGSTDEPNSFEPEEDEGGPVKTDS